VLKYLDKIVFCRVLKQISVTFPAPGTRLIQRENDRGGAAAVNESMPKQKISKLKQNFA
jgi:hypothetical protein